MRFSRSRAHIYFIVTVFVFSSYFLCLQTKLVTYHKRYVQAYNDDGSPSLAPLPVIGPSPSFTVSPKQENISTKERAERGRLAKERLEWHQIEQERLEKERAERERLEQERLEQERLEQERLEQERLEQERLEQERLEQERLEQGRLEQERLEQERLEQEHLSYPPGTIVHGSLDPPLNGEGSNDKGVPSSSFSTLSASSVAYYSTSCDAYISSVPVQERGIKVAGAMNTGTNLLSR